MKNHLKSSTKYTEIERELDSLKLLAMIKKMVYTGSTYDLNIQHKKDMAQMNLMNLNQDKFQYIQDFKDQYIAM